MKRIILTGGGTAGHVTPNIALIPELRKLGYDIHYIGSYNGMERKLIEDLNIPYHGISSGKLRRYFDLKNFTDPFRVIKGMGEAKKLMKELKPDVVFSKGGFVTVPVVFAAKSCNIPVIIHESDMTPGLANKLELPKASRVCCNFPETKDMFPEGKAVVTGTPIRKELFNGNAVDAINFCGFTDNKPVILIVGGSSGSAVINKAIRENIDKLLERFNVIHLCGKGNLDHSLDNKSGYVQYEYIKKELSSMLALADLIHQLHRRTDYAQHPTSRVPLRQVPLLDRTQCLRRCRIASQDYKLASLIEKRLHSLPCKTIHDLKRARTIRRTSVIAQINIIIPRHCFSDLIKNGKPSVTGVEDTNRTWC